MFFVLYSYNEEVKYSECLPFTYSICNYFLEVIQIAMLLWKQHSYTNTSVG